MHIYSLIATLLVVCSSSTTLVATISAKSNSASSAVGPQFSPPSAALNLLDETTPHTSPWPKAPWVYIIPGHSPQHLLFEEISPNDTGVEGQQSALHTCDEIVRWLWKTFAKDDYVDRACLQKSTFNGEKEGHVVTVFVPITKNDVIDRELALDSVRALENLIWRYGGHSLECEIWSEGKVKGRISMSITVSKENDVAVSDTVAAASNM